MNCKICSSNSSHIFSHDVLKKYNVKYFKCENCGFIQTENPYWLEEAYANVITLQDTGIMLRNQLLVKKASPVIAAFFDTKAKFLDYGGGYGIFVRMMRDVGFDFYWLDEYCENLVARGFELNSLTKKTELVTSFETFEHFTDPLAEIEKMLKFSDNILFTTEIVEDHSFPDPEKWWYYSFPSGQHIGFYTKKSFEIIAKKYSLNFYSNGFLHLFTKKDLNIAANSYFLNSFYKLKTKLKRKKLANPIDFAIFYSKVRPKFVDKLIKSKTKSDHDLLENNNTISH